MKRASTSTPSSWSPELRALTLQTLRDLPFHSFMNENRLHMKHFSGMFGYITLPDAIGGRMIVHIKDAGTGAAREQPAGEKVTFPDEEALVAAGWAVD